MKIEIDTSICDYVIRDRKGKEIGRLWNQSTSDIEKLLSPSSFADLMGNARLDIFSTSKKRLLAVFPNLNLSDFTF